MNSKFDITIYVITYNHEKYIKRCLDSILEQETKYKYLIKICDDASNDNTQKIILNYAKKYPQKIQLEIQTINTKGKHISALFRNIDTKYFALIDGDDYWCCKDKIDIALDYLNKNENVIMFVHDVLYKYNDVEKSLMHDILGINSNIVNPYNIKNLIHSHLSGRIYKNVIDFKNKYENVRKRDGILNEIFLAEGFAYYEDKIMSVYDKTTGGVWTSLSKYQEKFSSFYRIYMSDKTLKFKYNDIFINIYKLTFIKFLSRLIPPVITWNLCIPFVRFFYEFKEFYNIHKKYNKIMQGHNFYSKKELEILKKIQGEI